jgi:putative DNA methylase
MIPKECKRLAEVDFPIAVVSQHSTREKSIRHGHPSTLHLWWARRPLAACRAMLLALLLPDPCDPVCPQEFKTRARNILTRIQGKIGSLDSNLRAELLKFIAMSSNWDNSSNSTVLEAARGLIHATYVGEDSPLVVDTFSGGGSIPLEALRLGCDAFASDLNPVACLILRTLLQEAPRLGETSVAEIRQAAKDIRKTVSDELAPFYPKDDNGSTPIAYLWGRVVTCDTCGIDLPLMRSLWLSKKTGRKRALRYSIIRTTARPQVRFEVFEPKTDSELQDGFIFRGKAVCPKCHSVLSPERVRAQLKEQNGGADVILDSEGRRVSGALLFAVVLTDPASPGRHFRTAEKRDYQAIAKCKRFLDSNWSSISPLVPDEQINPKRPSPNARGLSAVTRAGVARFSDLFTMRQKVALTSIGKQVRKLFERGLSDATGIVAALALSRCTDRNSSLTRWDVSSDNIGSTFSRQALQMVWDFAEVNPFGGSSGDWNGLLSAIEDVLREVARNIENHAEVENADAIQCPMPDSSADVWFTDPPYYDAIPYADLSDYYYVWLRRILPSRILIQRFESDSGLTPKSRECVWNQSYEVDGRPKDGRFFEETLSKAFAEGRRILRGDGIGCVVFAHKSTEGWEALLGAIKDAGWVVTASWPITTEMANRLVAHDTASLAGSVHLVCRPRMGDTTGDWSEVLRELPHRVGTWIDRLQSEGVRGADLVFACIGPAMEIYSRYRRVEDAEGREIPLGGDPTATEPYKRGFLAYVWETVGRLALEQVLGTAEALARNGGVGALEEDSRLTALFLWTLQSTEVASNGPDADSGDKADEEEDEEEKPKKKKAGFTLIYDVARRFAQPLGIHLDKWEGRIIETDKGIVRLLPVAERGKQLFGEADASAISRRIERDVKASRNYTFAFMQDVGAAPEIKPRGRGRATASSGAAAAQAPSPQTVTTLDRLHAAMLLQSGGQANGLRALLREEIQRGPDFLRLANALSALYPKDSEEKRLLDAMLLAVPR